MLSQVKRSAIRTETLDAEVNSSRSSGRGEEEVGRDIKEEVEIRVLVEKILILVFFNDKCQMLMLDQFLVLFD